MNRYCFALDLVNDPEMIEEYESHHKAENFRPAITKSIRDAGIINMELYRTGDRLFMIMDTEDDFSFERKAAMDEADPAVQEWEQFMWKFQSPLPWASDGEKWVLMKKIYGLSANK